MFHMQIEYSLLLVGSATAKEDVDEELEEELESNFYSIIIKMPRKTRRMKGGNELTKIQTANRNLRTINRLEKAKPPLQKPGQIAQIGSGRMYGGALRDRYGQYLYVPKI